MRKPLIAGNWKMHGSKEMTLQLIQAIEANTKKFHDIDILICPPYVYLAEAIQSCKHLNVGAQNLHYETKGAFTGEIAANMLKDIGCKYVLVGHSERRTLFHESNDMVARKFHAAITAGLTPILCVGETETERKEARTEAVVLEQIQTVLDHAGTDAFKQAVIAYEPVWAIGTGQTATAEQAQAVHSFIRKHFAQINVDLAKTIRILYGGSMKAENAASLLSMPDIDGGLIGGASLDATSFAAICRAAQEKLTANAN